MTSGCVSKIRLVTILTEPAPPVLAWSSWSLTASNLCLPAPISRLCFACQVIHHIILMLQQGSASSGWARLPLSKGRSCLFVWPKNPPQSSFSAFFHPKSMFISPGLFVSSAARTDMPVFVFLKNLLAELVFQKAGYVTYPG